MQSTRVGYRAQLERNPGNYGKLPALAYITQGEKRIRAADVGPGKSVEAVEALEARIDAMVRITDLGPVVRTQLTDGRWVDVVVVSNTRTTRELLAELPGFEGGVEGQPILGHTFEQAQERAQAIFAAAPHLQLPASAEEGLVMATALARLAEQHRITGFYTRESGYCIAYSGEFKPWRASLPVPAIAPNCVLVLYTEVR